MEAEKIVILAEDVAKVMRQLSTISKSNESSDDLREALAFLKEECKSYIESYDEYIRN